MSTDTTIPAAVIIVLSARLTIFYICFMRKLKDSRKPLENTQNGAILNEETKI